ncbi:MAG: hypothetical protein ACFFDP_09525 [Promethearchaeota archaeon]
MEEEVAFPGTDILSGKIDPDRIQSRYVFLYRKGGPSNVPVDPIKAANLMAKFGWRVVGITNWCVLLERES